MRASGPPLAALLLAGCAALGTAVRNAPFRDAFDGPDGPPGPGWVVTSGKLELRGGKAETASPVFRVITRRRDFRDAEVSFSLLNRGLAPGPHTPETDWDGVHVFLRYQSQYHLYYASVNRRDNAVVIKKKVPGGPSNGGTYHELSPKKPYVVPYGEWQRVRAVVRDVPQGVAIEAHIDGKLLVRAIDTGRLGGPPIRKAGRVGVRADNADILIDEFVAAEPPPSPGTALR